MRCERSARLGDGFSQQWADNVGFVYVLANPCMPGLIKIGFTTETMERRLYELNRATGVPLPFHCAYVVVTEYSKQVEGEVHRLLSSARVSSRREFFRCSPRLAVRTIRSLMAERDIWGFEVPLETVLDTPQKRKDSEKRDQDVVREISERTYAENTARVQRIVSAWRVQ